MARSSASVSSISESWPFCGMPLHHRQQIGEAALRRLAVFGGHADLIVTPDKVRRMDKGRARIEPPDLSEKGGLKDGAPQRSDERLFMQLLAFGGCADALAVATAPSAAPASTASSTRTSTIRAASRSSRWRADPDSSSSACARR